MTRILVADDNAASRDLLRYLLRGPGREILDARDGHEALAGIERHQPDVVLLDIQMPALDGYEVVARLRRDPRFRSVPVIAVTAQAMVGERERSLAAGFNEYMTKPVDGAALRRTVDRLLAARNGTE